MQAACQVVMHVGGGAWDGANSIRYDSVTLQQFQSHVHWYIHDQGYTYHIEVTRVANTALNLSSQFKSLKIHKGAELVNYTNYTLSLYFILYKVKSMSL